ncbi:MAG: family 10 glycosylhydrolase [Flavobacteriaceae bacterium]
MGNLRRLKNKTGKSVWGLLALLLIVISCKETTTKEEVQEQSTAEVLPGFKKWTWFTANAKKTDSFFSEEFKKYADHGIDAVLINTGTDPVLLQRLVPLAKNQGLEVHAWMFTVNRPGDSIAQQHPEWYSVSRDGKSCFDDPPYVGYYKWLCPTREASRNHILSLVEGLAEVDGVASVHLDYIRYSDIFLPIGLLPKYNLKQEVELPRFDFCYCEVCAEEFKKIHHKDPRELENPSIDIEWKNFRLNQVKKVVDASYKIAHAHGKKLTAAVFPYPEMADHMVRQRWDKWQIDVVLPMIYHNFYNEEIDWIGYATRQGISDLRGRDTQLHTGLYLPGMSVGDVREAMQEAKDNGALGVAFFDGPAITPEQWEVIQQFK